MKSPFAPLIPFDHPANLANEDGTLKGRAMPKDDLELIRETLREIIANETHGHDGHTRLAAMKMLYELFGK